MDTYAKFDAPQPFDHLRRAAEATPDRPALVSPSETISYLEMYRLVTRCANAIRGMGFEAGDIVALNVPDIPDTVLNFALFHEALTAVPFTTALVNDPLFETRMVFTTQPIEGFPADRQFLVTDDWMAKVTMFDVDIEPKRYPSSDSLCLLAVSSGTTGKPKAIAMSIDHLERGSEVLLDSYLTGRSFIALGTARMGPGAHFRYDRIRRGETLYLPGATSRETLRLLALHGLEAISGSPTQLASFLDAVEAEPELASSLAVVRANGGQTPSSVVDRFLALNSQLIFVNSYGSTEAHRVTIRSELDVAPNYMGELLDYATVQIVDDNDSPVPDGVDGTIRVKTPYQISGYYNDPETTAKFFRDGWFYPGDLGRLEGNKLYLAGRATEVINAGGVKVDPNAVDDVVLTVPGITSCATFAIRGNNDVDVVACAYVAEREFIADELVRVVVDRLGSMTPRRWFRVDAIPVGHTGKPLRRELTERFSTV